MNFKQNPQGDVMVLELSGKIMGGPDHEKFQNEIKTLIAEGSVDILLNMAKVNSEVAELLDNNNIDHEVFIFYLMAPILLFNSKWYCRSRDWRLWNVEVI